MVISLNDHSFILFILFTPFFLKDPRSPCHGQSQWAHMYFILLTFLFHDLYGHTLNALDEWMNRYTGTGVPIRILQPSFSSLWLLPNFFTKMHKSCVLSPPAGQHHSYLNLSSNNKWNVYIIQHKHYHHCDLHYSCSLFFVVIGCL